VELEKEFLVKKEADAYDKMLDAAENLAEYIKAAELKIDLDGKVIDAISVFLAKNGPEVARILKGLKPIVASAQPPAEKKEDDAPAASAKKKIPRAKPTPKKK
jgi:dsDNA-binding SOS-regulon protein